MTNAAEYRHEFELVWAERPIGPAYPERTQRWLFDLSEKAKLNRSWPLAEAALREFVWRCPNTGYAWALLSSIVGRRGRYQEAADLAQRSLERPAHLDGQSKTIKALWLWQLGRQDAARALVASIAKPTDGSARSEQMWLAGQMYFLAVADQDTARLQSVVQDLMGRPGNGYWSDALKRDPCFDPFRRQPWFIAAVGDTATGTPPEHALPAPAEAADLDALIPSLPHDANAGEVRQVLADAYDQLDKHQWDRALESAILGEGADPPLAESFIVHALALIGKGDVPGALGALHEFRRRGYGFAEPPFDGQSLWTRIQIVADAANLDARVGGGSRSRVAAAAVVRGMILLDFHQDAAVMREMSAAFQWDAQIPEVYVLRGRCLLNRREFAKAEADYRQALAFDPSSVPARCSLAELEGLKGRPENALRLIDQALEIAGTTHPAVGMLRARFLIDTGHLDQGLAALATFGDVKPLPPRGYDQGCCLVAFGCDLQHRFAEAEATMRQAIAFAPHHPEYRLLLSLDLGRQGRWQEALDVADEALILSEAGEPGVDLVRASWLVRLARTSEAQAIIDHLRPPGEPRETAWVHTMKAVYAAQAGNEEMLERELGEVVAAHEGSQINPLIWMDHEVFFDSYREKPWFMALMRAGHKSMDEAMSAAAGTDAGVKP